MPAYNIPSQYASPTRLVAFYDSAYAEHATPNGESTLNRGRFANGFKELSDSFSADGRAASARRSLMRQLTPGSLPLSTTLLTIRARD